jgi:hypothetical protein
MAEIIPAIFKVKQGNMADLPALQPGEFGYAKDTRRLFIGNDEILRDGDGSTTDFNLGTDLDNLSGTYKLYVDNILQIEGIHYLVDNYIVRFNTPPSTGTANIKLLFNSEITLTDVPEGINNNIPKSASLSFTAPTPVDFNFITIDGSRFGDVQIRYTIINTSGDRRKGTLNISIDAANNIFDISDSYTLHLANPAINALKYNFNGSMSGGVFVLNYTLETDELEAASITWIEENFLVGGGIIMPPGGSGAPTFDGDLLYSINKMNDVDTVTTTPNVGQVLIWNGVNWVPGDSSGSSVLGRDTLTASTSEIPDGDTENVDIANAATTYSVLSITTNQAAWIRIYSSDAARTADAGRLEGVDPDPDAGVHSEVITTGATIVKFTPASIAWNDESPVNDTVYLAVTNKSGASNPVNVEILILRME